MPTDAEIARAQRAGRAFARAGRPVADCPYNADGDGSQRVLARRWVRGYLSVLPSASDYVD